MPLGRRMSPLELAEVFLAESQLANAYLDTVFIQQSHHHRLAVAGGDHAHAQVEFLLPHRDLDATVLGSSPLGNVQLGENFDA